MASLSSLSDLQIEDIMYRLDYIEAYRLASTNSRFLRIFDRIKNRLAYRDLGYLNKLEKYKRNKKYYQKIQENYRNFYELRKILNDDNLLYNKNVDYTLIVEGGIGYPKHVINSGIADNMNYFGKYVRYILRHPDLDEEMTEDLLYIGALKMDPELFDFVYNSMDENLDISYIIPEILFETIMDFNDNESEEKTQRRYDFFAYLINNDLLSRNVQRDILQLVEMHSLNLYHRYDNGPKMAKFYDELYTMLTGNQSSENQYVPSNQFDDPQKQQDYEDWLDGLDRW